MMTRSEMPWGNISSLIEIEEKEELCPEFKNEPGFSQGFFSIQSDGVLVPCHCRLAFGLLLACSHVITVKLL